MKDEDRRKYFWVLIFLLLPLTYDVVIGIQQGLFFSTEYSAIVQFAKEAEEAHMPPEQIAAITKMQFAMKHATADFTRKCVNTMFIYMLGFAGLVLVYSKSNKKTAGEKIGHP